MLDPRERCTVAECLEHAAFETERLLHRNSTSTVGRRSRKQSASRIIDVNSRNASRPSSVIRSKTPSNILSEHRFTPVPPEKMELGSFSPDHLHVADKRHETPAEQWQEPENQQSHGGTMRTSPDGRDNSDMEQNAAAVTEPSQVEEVSASRFIRKKLVAGSKPTDEDTELPAPSLLPAVEDAAQKERGTAAVSTPAKKTYSINVCGAAVPAQRTKKTPAQTPHVNAVTVKGSPLAERKTKVC